MRLRAFFEDRQATTSLVWVYCDADTMLSYIRRRGAARDAAKLADWPGYLSRINVDYRPADAHVLVDNCASSTPLQSQAKELLRDLLAGDRA